MKIACITAGAGRMYCGSCLRDNALASALLAAGHDVLLIPTYTPTRTDETNVSMPRVFLGGINIYLQQHFGLFRNSPDILDRLWDFKPLLKLVTRLGMSVNPTDLGSLTVSMLRGHKRISQKRDPEACSISAGNFARGRQPAQLHAHFAGSRNQSGNESAGLLHAAGGGFVSWIAAANPSAKSPFS